MLMYLIKSGASLGILFLFYTLFLEKENMHVFKRFYLLLALVFALIIPAIVFTEYVEIPAPTYTTVHTTTITNEVINVPPALEADVLDIASILWGIYFLGLVFFGIKFIRNLFQIFKRIRKNPKNKLARFTQVLLLEKIPPHTFFSFIFLNKKKLEANEIPKEVLLHEETHANQKHSWDVVFVEFLQVLFWCNPFVYLTKKSIKLNHEFLADQAVLKKDIDQTTYQNTLLSYLSPDSKKKYRSTMANAITNSSYSSIKKRFKIMKTHTSRKSVLIKSVLIIPLLALLIYGFGDTKIERIVVDPVSNITSETEYSAEETQPSQFNLEEWKNENSTIKINVNDYGHIRIIGELKLVSLSEIDEVIKHQLAVKKEVLRAIIEVEKNAPKKVVGKIEDILDQNNIPQINIVGTEDSLRSTFLNSIPKQITEYNILAKKYNAVPIEKRVIPLNDLKILENTFKMMTPIQKSKAEPFPECQPNATQEPTYLIGEVIEIEINKIGELSVKGQQVALNELRSTLEKYNSSLSMEEKRSVVAAIIYVETDAHKILIHEVSEILIEYGSATIDVKNIQDGATKEQLGEYNALAKKYNLMLSKDKSIHIKMNDVERLEYIYGLMSDEQKDSAEPFPDFPEPPPMPEAQKAPKAPKVKKGEKSNVPPPPPAPNAPDHKYLEEEEIEEMIENQEIIVEEIGQKYIINTPPKPPAPQAPIDHIIEMAKKDAVFYYEGKEISSDKAIDILKKNKEINIDSRTTKGKRPTVKLSIEPITIDY